MIENGEVEKPEDANLLLQKVCVREEERGWIDGSEKAKEGEQGRRRGKRQGHRESRGGPAKNLSCVKHAEIYIIGVVN